MDKKSANIWSTAAPKYGRGIKDLQDTKSSIYEIGGFQSKVAPLYVIYLAHYAIILLTLLHLEV